jgi:hypothetical protein
MLKVIAFLKSELAFLIAACSIAFGLYFVHFPVLMSGVALLLCVSGLLQQNFKSIFTNKYLLAICFLFVLMFLSGIYTDANHLKEWGSEVQRKFSFVLISIGVAGNASRVTFKNIIYIIQVFLLSTTIVAVMSFANYLLHYDYLNQKILESQGLPIVGGVSHISFSIMCVLAIGLCLYMYGQSRSLVSTNKINAKYIYALVVVLLYIIFHFISSRTGWVSLYMALISVLIQQIVKSKKYILGFSILACIIISPLLAYFFVDSFHNKVVNTVEDVSRYFSGDYIGFYSVSMRFEAWRVCWQLFMEHPFIGVASADLGDSMQVIYNSYGVSDFARVFEAHNQFLEYAACFGIVGLIALIWVFYLLLTNKGLNNFLVLYFTAVCFGSFLFESFLEIQVGIAFFTLFYMLVNIYKENTVD